jgi:4-hydroxy-2-oxoheptanedioate aldolase
MQHGLADYHAAVTMLQAVGLGDSTPLVRVPWNEPGIIGRMLDAGAMGIIIPMVNTVAEAEAAVAACRYAPAGARSFGPIRAAMQEGPTYFERANAEVASIANLDDILAVPGIDAVYVGPADLSVTLGLPPGNNDDAAAFTEALEAIVAACGRAGVVPGIHASAALAQRRREQGFRLMTIATDLGSLMAGARSDLKIALSESAPQEGDTRRVY